ncbi:PAS domain S-box protein, partial [Sulfurimonas sp.]|uniref:PAS domain S-box protein n=1 Tax=Sulfurimonas sp. TaxID=2022749 RepID=UPI0025E80ECA
IQWNNANISLKKIIEKDKKFNKNYFKQFKILKEEKQIITNLTLINNQLELINAKMNVKLTYQSHVTELNHNINKLQETLQLFHNELRLSIDENINNNSEFFIWTLLLFFIFNIAVLTMHFFYKYSMKNLIKKVRRREERLNYAIEATKDGLWDWNLETNEVYYSSRWKETLGYKDNELPNLYQRWMDRVHPDDIEQAKLKASLSHKNKDVLYESIHRLKHKDGHWIWALSRGKTIFDENSKPLRMIGFYTDITEQKNVEDELIASKQQFESFTKNIPGMVSIRDKKDRIAYANKELQTFLEEKDLIGKYASDFVPNKISKKMDELNLQAKEEGFAEAIIQHVDINNKPSIYKSMVFSIGKEENAQTGFMHFNITQEYKDQYEIAIFKQVLQSAPVSIIFTDINGNIEYVNPYFCNLTGYSLEEVIGINPKILKSDYHTNEEYIELWEKITNNQVWSGTFKNIKKNGDVFWESSIISPVSNENGEIINYISIKQEITEQIHLREKLASKEDIIIAQSRHAAMGEMIGMIAHQWRQPLSVIAMGANNLLIDIDLDETNQENVAEEAQSIIKQTEYLSKTIDDFRNFFRPNKEVEEVAVEEVVDEAKKIIGKSLENKQINLSINTKKSYIVKTFSRELLQVFINIFKNAEEALVENREFKRFINIDITNDISNVIVIISDNGGGIDKKIIDKIFNPYFSTKSEKTGTGLGLYMSKTIIQKHLKGTIEVFNIEEGTSFIIKIPMKWKSQ